MPLTRDQYAEALTKLTPEERLEIAKLMDQLPIWIPQPGPQTMALESVADVIGYGGSAGGGKTDLGIGAALTTHQKSIIFRPQYPQLADIERRAKEITDGKRVGFNGADHILTMPDGRTIEFGACSDENEARKFRGRPHDLKVFDEVTEFKEIVVRFITAWARTTRYGQKTQSILTFNPPQDLDGEWVVSYFAPWLDPYYKGTPARPGEIRWFAQMNNEHNERVEVEVDGPGPFIEIDDKTGRSEKIYSQSRTFIPAKLADNKYLDGDGEYRRQLQSLPEPLRSQLLYGDMNLERIANPWQVIPTQWVLDAMKRSHTVPKPSIALTALGIDVAHGGKDKTCFAPRYGVWFGKPVKFPGVLTPDGATAARLAVKYYRELNLDDINRLPGKMIEDPLIIVDGIGFGASCAEKLKDPKWDGGYELPVMIVNVANSDSEKGLERYTDKSGKFFMVNLRAEMLWRMRELLDPDNGFDAVLPDDRELLGDLCVATYKTTPAGIRVETKEEIKSRTGGKSTDVGDAYCLTLLEDDSVQYREVNVW